MLQKFLSLVVAPTGGKAVIAGHFSVLTYDGSTTWQPAMAGLML